MPVYSKPTLLKSEILAASEGRTYSVFFARRRTELGNRVAAEGLLRFLEAHHLLGD